MPNRRVCSAHTVISVANSVIHLGEYALRTVTAIFSCRQSRATTTAYTSEATRSGTSTILIHAVYRGPVRAMLDYERQQSVP
jgi:hypothetical protein